MLSYDKRLMKRIVLQLMNFDDAIKISARAEQDIVSLLTYLRYESAILFHLGEVDYIFYPKRKEAVLHPRYLYSKKGYDGLVRQLTAVVEKIREQVCIAASPYQRELRIHDFLCSNVMYSDEGEQSHSMIGPLLFRRGVCDGFSKAAKVLLQECGIVSHVIKGTAALSSDQYEPHAWNVVCIDSKWYHLDATLDNTLSRTGIRYDYFNLSADAIMRDHNIENTTEFSSIECTCDNDYYMVSGLYFQSLASIRKYLNQCLTQRITHIQLRAGRKINKKDIVHLFSQSLKTINSCVTYDECINEFRNIYSWRIVYA